MSDEREARVNEIIADYLDAQQAGRKPDAQEVLARHPDLAKELATFFADHELLAVLAPADTPTQDGSPPAATDSALGKVRYFGDYELLEEIDRGAFGVVYRARQVSLNRVVALKMILAGQLASEADVQRFRQEAENAASLDHPHIVPIYEVGEHEGQHYFSMKLIEGGNLGECLATLLRSVGDATLLRSVANLLATVARAVHYAHQRGILHRDLKPANILLEWRAGDVNSPNPHVTDFGLAKRLSGKSLTQSGAIVGTIEYMAPEQAQGRKGLTTAADVYSLGAILYTLLAGRPPFRGETVLDTLQQLVEQNPDPPRRHNLTAPRDLETICLKCLEKEPSRRYGSAEALAHDLERWLKGEPILARPAGRVERLVKWVKRKPAVAGLSAALMLVALTAFTLVLISFQREREQRRRAESNAVLAQQHAADATEALGSEQKAKEEADKQRVKAQEAEAQSQSQLDRARRTLYSMQMMKVSGLYQQDAGHARQLLEDPELFPLDLRDFSWRFHHRQCRRDLLSLCGLSGELGGGFEAIAWSPDGRLIASSEFFAADRVRVRLWDSVTGCPRVVLEGNQSIVSALAFSPDGKLLATASWRDEESDGEVRVWDVGTEKELVTLRHRGIGNSVAFSPDGKLLASVNRRGPAVVWDVARWKEKLTIPLAQDKIAFSPDGKLVAAGSRREVRAADDFLGPGRGMDTVQLWDAATGQEAEPFVGSRAFLQRLTFSPEGKLLVSHLDTWLIWDPAAGTVENPSPSRDGMALLRPDGKAVAVFDMLDDSCWIRDAFTGKQLLSLRGCSPSGAFSPDGRRLATDSPESTVKVWDVDLSDEADLLKGHETFVSSLQFSGNGKILCVVSSDGFLPAGRKVTLWDVAERKQLHTFSASRSHLTPMLDREGKHLTAAGEAPVDKDGKHRLQIQRWETATGKKLDAYTLILGDRYPGALIPMSDPILSTDGRWLAVSVHLTERVEVQLWDLQTRKAVMTLKRNDDLGDPLAFSPDGSVLATGAASGDVKLWSTATRSELATLRGHTDATGLATFRPDGRMLATGSSDQSVRLWDLDTGREHVRLRCEAASLAFSVDGDTLAAGGKLWDVRTGHERGTIPHGGNMVAFSPDGHTLAANFADGSTVKIWRATPEPERRSYRILNEDSGSTTLLNDNYLALRSPLHRMIEVRDLETGRESLVPPLRAPYTQVSVMAMSRYGHLFALAGMVEATDNIKVMTAHDGKENATLKHPNAHALVFRHDTHVLASAAVEKASGRTTIKLWDLKSIPRQELRTIQCPDGAWRMVFDPEGKTLAVFGGPDDQPGEVKLYDVASGAELRSLKGHARAVADVAFSLDGKLLAAAGGGEVKLWDLVSGRERATLQGHRERVRSVAFSPDSKLLASGGADGTARLWDPATGKEIAVLEGHTAGIRSLVFRAGFLDFNQDLTVLCDDETVRTWDVTAWWEKVK